MPMMKGNDRYPIPGLTCTIDGRTQPVANLSVGGFFVETSEPEVIGRVVTALLAIKGGVALEVMGKVAWVNDAVRPRVAHLPPGFGLKIQRISFRDRMEILRLLGEAGTEFTGGRRAHGASMR
jgi:Tfp pilus assembly protein PilZ